MVILGIIAIAGAPITGFVSVMLLGAFMIVGGAIEAFHALSHWKTGNRLLFLLGGILSAVVGVLLVARTGIGLAAISLMLAGYFIANGLFHAITAVADRYERWGWDLVMGLVSLALGFIVIAQWPVSSIWLVGTLVGIDILFRGFALMAAASTMRWLVRQDSARANP